MVTEEMKNKYIAKVYAEMDRRGIGKDDADRVIAKTGFISSLNLYPEEQIHYSVEDAVNEIIEVAALAK